MKFLGFLLILLFSMSIANAQTVRGTLMDPVEGIVVKGATVELLKPADSTVIAAIASDSSGTFLFNNVAFGAYVLRASSIGFETLLTSFNLTDSMPSIDFADLYIPKKTTTLEGVVIVVAAPAVSQKGDTTQFAADRFKVNPDASTEDLIKKMPGIVVDRNGKVTAQGEQVKKVTVDGKDFFGDDATATLRNLPADVVNKIQVFDRLSDQAQLTGFDDGNSVKAINIVTKNGVDNSNFGKLWAGYGTNERYSAGGNVNFFNRDRRVSIFADLNNVNTQNFSSQDIVGAGNANGASTNGINKTSAAGLNFSDKWGEKLSVQGSYQYNNTYNTTQSKSLRQTFLNNDTTQYSGNKSFRTSNNNNHQVNLRLEYNIDSNNTILFIPNISFQNNQSSYEGANYAYYRYANSDALDSVNSSQSNSEAKRNGYNIGNNIMYRHSFTKKGRSLSLSLQANYSKNDGTSYSDNDLKFYDVGLATDSLLNQFRNNARNGYNYSARTAYTEPVGKQGQFQFEYNYSVQKNKSNQETYEYDGSDYSIFQPEFSNKFDNTVTTNRAEIDYRLGRSRDNQFSVGIDFQNSKLESNRIYPMPTMVNQSFNTFLPNLRWMKKVGVNSNIRIFYRARTDFPDISQLQDVVDNSNPLNVTSGNPALKQSYTHFLSGRYNYINKKNGQSFYANIFARLINNYISSATYIPISDSVVQNDIVVKGGSQFLKPVNLNGYKQFNSYFTYSIPINNFLKSNLNLNAGFNYTQRPGLINYMQTKSTSTGISGGLVWGSNISEYVDFNLNYGGNFSNTKSTANQRNNRSINQSAGVFLNLLTKNGWFLQNDVSNRSNSGLSEGYNQSFWLWNAAVGKKILKNHVGELKLSVFDLLKQNQSIGRTIGDNYILDSENNVLQQYFMLTFTYKLKNFGKGNPNQPDRRREWRGGDRPGGGFRGGGGGRPGGGF